MTTRAGLDHVRELMALATGDEKHDESSTSTLDALWVLYDRVLRVDPGAPKDEARDRFILSKGHGPSAYYAVLAAKGFFPEGLLAGFLSGGTRWGRTRIATRFPASRRRPARSATASRSRSVPRWRSGHGTRPSSASSCSAVTRS